MLLNRRNWPHSIGAHEQVTDVHKTDADDLDAYRDAFISHYGAVRDIRAIANASSLLKDSSDSKSGKEYAMQQYKSTKGAPVFTSDDCLRANVRVWPESVDAEKVGARALAVYSHDYNLRLFEVVPRNNASGPQSSSGRSTKCRQIACVRAIPPSVLQRRSGYGLMGLDMDEDVVASLFSCGPDTLNLPLDPFPAFLSIISRDDLACAGNEGLIEDDALQEFDICAMVLDFLLCGADHVDHLQAALHDFLSIGDGDTSHIRVDVSPTLVACGQGYFLFHAFIRIPVEIDDVNSDDSEYDSDDDRSSVPHSVEGHIAFLLSVKKGTIVKAIHVDLPFSFGEQAEMYASNPTKQHFSTANAVSVRKLCTNVVVKSIDPNHQDWLNLSIQISKDGVDIQVKAIIEYQHIQPVLGTVEEVVVTSSCVVATTKSSVGTCLVFVYDDENENSLDTAVHTIEIGGSYTETSDMFCIREDYVAVLLETRQDREHDEDAVAGEWFGLDEEEQSSKREVVLFHIYTRQKLFRCPLPFTHTFCLDCLGDTIAASASNLGFVIAGGNAREVARTSLIEEGETSQTPTKTTKAKKKRLASLASGRKKDGFARGMSMRG